MTSVERKGRLSRLRNLHGLPALALASLAAALISQANIGRVAIRSKEALVNMQTAWTWESFLAVIAGWSPADFDAYWAHYTPDAFHPFIYGWGGAALMAWSLRSSRLSERWNVLIFWVPLAGALDLVENFCHGIAIDAYPDVPYWCFAIGNRAAIAKWILAASGILLMIVISLFARRRSAVREAPADAPDTADPLPDITANLRVHADARPDTVALHFPRGKVRGAGWDTLTYRELEVRTEAFARGCLRMGMKRGDAVLLMFPPTLQFYPVFFGLLRAGLVPIFIDPSMGVRKALACVKSIAPRVMIAPPVLHVATFFMRSVFHSIELGVVAGRLGWGFGPTIQALEATDTRDAMRFDALGAHDDACVVFTSGATGPPKAVVMSRACMRARMKHSSDMLGVETGTQVVETLLVYTLMWLIGGLRVAVPEIDVTSPAKAEPESVIDAIEKYRPVVASASLIVWQRLVRHAQGKTVNFPSLRKLVTSSAPIPVALHEDLRTFVNPEVQLYTPYGATEALPVTNIGTEEILAGAGERTLKGEGICLGQAAPGMDIRIIKRTDDALASWAAVEELPQGELGEIVVAGEGVSREYRNAPAANRASKIHGDGRFWHRMGDLGYLDEEGRLWFCGRTSHRLETADGLVPAVPVEQIFIKHPDVFRAALVGVGRAGNQMPVLCVELESGVTWSDALRDEIRTRATGTRWENLVETVLLHPALPTDPRHNSKIMRPELAEWAASQLSGAAG